MSLFYHTSFVNMYAIKWLCVFEDVKENPLNEILDERMKSEIPFFFCALLHYSGVLEKIRVFLSIYTGTVTLQCLKSMFYNKCVLNGNKELRIPFLLFSYINNLQKCQFAV